MGEWKEYKLGEVTLKIGSGSTPRGGSNAYKSSGISLIRSQNILDFKFSQNGLAFIDAHQANILKGVTVLENDVLFNITGDSVARCCLAPKDYLPARVNQHVAIIRTDNSKLDSQFLLYYLQSIKEHLLMSAEIGATRNAITKSMLENLVISLPPLKEQRRIASILSSFDDKIDLLHRQNQTLEAMAETLFRKWFIEDAKPEWEIGVVSNVSQHSKVSIIPKKERSTFFSHYSIPAFDNGKNPTKELGSAIQSNKYQVQPNSILFSKLNPHKDKRLWLILDSVQPNGVCSTEFQILKPHDKAFLYYLYGWLSYKDNYDAISSGVGGTSGSHQRIAPNEIFSYECPLVDRDYLVQYNKHIEPIFEKIHANMEHIRSLTKLRDTLLPKLMSNEIQV